MNVKEGGAEVDRQPAGRSLLAGSGIQAPGLAEVFHPFAIVVTSGRGQYQPLERDVALFTFAVLRRGRLRPVSCRAVSLAATAGNQDDYASTVPGEEETEDVREAEGEVSRPRRDEPTIQSRGKP